jgi:hypothetical protein
MELLSHVISTYCITFSFSFLFLVFFLFFPFLPFRLSVIPLNYFIIVCLVSIEVRSPAKARGFSSNLCVQTGSGAHPASCTMGTGVKRGRCVTLTIHLHLVPRS